MNIKKKSEGKKVSGLLTKVVTSLLHLEAKVFILFIICNCCDPVGAVLFNERSFIVRGGKLNWSVLNQMPL